MWMCKESSEWLAVRLCQEWSWMWHRSWMFALCAWQKEPHVHRLPSKWGRAESLLGLVHSDISGLAGASSVRGSHYLVSFIEDHNRYCFPFELKTMDEVFKMFRKWLKYVGNLVGTKAKSIATRESVLRALHTDSGGEYLSSRFYKTLERHGIEHKRSIPHNPKQNGLGERFNQTLMDMMGLLMRCE